MMRNILYSIVFFSLLALVLLLAIPPFIDASGYVEEFAQQFKENTQFEVQIEGESELALLPRPRLIMSQVRILFPGGKEPLMDLPEFVLGTNWSMLFGKGKQLSIDRLTLVSPRISLRQNQKKDRSAMEKFFAFSDNLSAAKQIPEVIKIENGAATIYSRQLEYTIANIDVLATYNSADASIDMHGSFEQAGQKVEVVVDDLFSKTGAENKLSLTSPLFSLDMIGKYNNETQALDYRLRGDIKNAAQFSNSFFPFTVLKKVTSQMPLSFEGEGHFGDQSFALTQWQVDSDLAKMTLEMKGHKTELTKELENGEVQKIKGVFDVDMLLNVALLDVDALTKTEEKEEEQQYYMQENEILLQNLLPRIPKRLRMVATVELGTLKYRQKQIEKLNFIADIFDGAAYIERFDMTLPGNSHFSLRGSLEDNGVRTEFQGDANIRGDQFRELAVWIFPQIEFVPENKLNKFLANWQFAFTPQSAQITDLRFSVDEAVFGANWSMRPSRNLSIIQADISLEHARFDRYAVPDFMRDYVLKFMRGAEKYNLEGSPLKLYDKELNLSLRIGDATYNGYAVEKANADIILRPGILNVKGLDIDSNGFDAKGGVLINLQEQIPQLQIALQSKKLFTDFFMGKPKKQTVPDPQAGKSKPWQWSKEQLNFLGLRQFGGEAKVVIGDLKHGEHRLQRNVIHLGFNRSVIDIKKIDSYYFTGNLLFKGKLAIGTAPGFALSFHANNVNFATVDDLFAHEFGVQGVASLSGSMESYGNSFYEWVNNATSKINIIAKNTVIPGLDLHRIVRASPRTYSTIDMREIVNKSLVSGKTLYQNIRGKFTTNKGVLQTKNIVFSTPEAKGVYAGNMSLHNFSIKGLMKILFAPDPNSQVSIGFKLSGDIKGLEKEAQIRQLEDYITAKAQK